MIITTNSNYFPKQR